LLRIAALADGKSEEDARDLAHEAAKAHWNSWAEGLIAKRKGLEHSGAWATEKNLFGRVEPKNGETRKWMEEAETNFSRCLFLEQGDEETKDTAREVWKALEDDSLPGKSIAIDRACVDMRGFVFPGFVSFDGAIFSGNARFASVTFSIDASFASATYQCGASFDSVTFSGDAFFTSAAFSGEAWFNHVTFLGTASFESATFSGDAWFGSATFSGDASFRRTAFLGYTRFFASTFSGFASFVSATFSGEASFVSTTFSTDARFASASFSGDARFERACFSGAALFDTTAFRNVDFHSAAFLGNATFRNVSFSSAIFARAVFQGLTTFANAHFQGLADFYAIRCERLFDLTNCIFHELPIFIQAYFNEAPLLQGIRILSQMIFSGTQWDQPARYRAIRRLASQGHNRDAEALAFAGEIRSARFVSDWPIPFAFWKGDEWRGFLRFWVGLYYEIFLGFSNSLLRPIAWWLLVAAAAMIYFYGQSPEASLERNTLRAQGVTWIGSYWQTTKAGRSCHNPPINDGEKIYYSGLSDQLSQKTGVLTEAALLAGRNMFVFLDVNSDAEHRIYSCLYGLERYAGNPVPIVPPNVSIATIIQKLISAIFLFFIGLSRARFFEEDGRMKIERIKEFGKRL
jgi:uncharacterized protein YjbI with pentapeptide repeats